MGRNQQSNGGIYAGIKVKNTYASGGKGGGSNTKTVDAATALGLGALQQNTMLSGLAGLGIHCSATNSSGVTLRIRGDEHDGRTGWLDNRPTVCKQWEWSTLTCGPTRGLTAAEFSLHAQLLQVRQVLAQQQTTQVTAHQAEIQNRIETEATTRAAELVRIEKEKQKQKSSQDANATKPDEDDTTSRGSANGRSQGARKRKSVAEANAKKAKVEKERDGLRRAPDILEDHLGTGTRPYSDRMTLR